MQKLKESMQKANKNYKNEIRNLIILNVCFLIISILTLVFIKKYSYAVYFFITIMIFNFYYLSRYSRIIKRDNKNLVLDFIETFSYFRIYISNNMNVYQAFNQIKKYSSIKINDLLEKLLIEIDNDKSIKPYINFASNFNDEKVEEVMIAIYEMVNEGNNEIYLNQFVTIFTNFKNRVLNCAQYRRETTFNTINNFSLFGVGTLMISMMFGIVKLLGEYLA